MHTEMPERPASREKMDVDRDRRKVTRESRRSLTGASLRLTADTDPNYHYRWVNDDPGRIAKFENAGYVVVKSKDAHAADGIGDSVASVAAGLNVEGRERRTFLMRLPREWHEDDIKEKRKIVDETEAPVHEARAGKATRPVSGPEATQTAVTGEFYTPMSGTSLRRQTGGS